MTRGKLPVFVLVVGLLTVAGLLGLLTVPNAAAIDWCTPLGLSMSPSVGYAGDTDPVSITLTNGVNTALQVSEIDVTFGWSSTTWNWGSMSLAAYGSATNAYSVTLPSTTGDYVTTIVVHGQAAGDWLAATCTFSRTFSVQTLPPAPTVIATGNPTTGPAPLSVSFSATVSQGLAPFSYAWTFGDGSSDSGAYVTHTYQSPNTYTAQVVVTDSRGRSASSSVTVTVSQASGSGGGNGGGSNVGPQSTDWTPILAAVGILVIAAVGVAGLLIARGRRRRAAPPQQPYQPPMPPP